MPCAKSGATTTLPSSAQVPRAATLTTKPPTSRDARPSRCGTDVETASFSAASPASYHMPVAFELGVVGLDGLAVLLAPLLPTLLRQLLAQRRLEHGRQVGPEAFASASSSASIVRLTAFFLRAALAGQRGTAWSLPASATSRAQSNAHSLMRIVAEPQFRSIDAEAPVSRGRSSSWGRRSRRTPRR